MANWSDLNTDLLYLILRRIYCLQDFIAFMSVCSAWRALAVKEQFNCEVPWLMFVNKENIDDDNSRKFLNPSEGIIYRNRIQRPAAAKEYCLTSKGWILMSENGTQFSLLNPFSLSKISLPQIQCVRDGEPFIVRNVVDFALSCTPSCSSSFMVMIIYTLYPYYWKNATIALYKHGDNDWTKIDTGYYMYNKITHLKGRFYVISNNSYRDGCINVLEVERIRDSILKRTVTFDDPWKGRRPSGPALERKTSWLAESCGALIMVSMKVVIKVTVRRKFAYEFEVAEMDLESRVLKKVNDLGDSAIFLGERFCSLVHQVSRHNYKSNHIYFLNSNRIHFEGSRYGLKVHVYSLQDGTVDSFFEHPDRKAIWVEPRF